MKEGINRQGIHTFWRNYVSKLRKEKKKTNGEGVVYPCLSEPEKFKFTWKLPNIVQVQVC
jgi:hypothetical protein